MLNTTDEFVRATPSMASMVVSIPSVVQAVTPRNCCVHTPVARLSPVKPSAFSRPGLNTELSENSRIRRLEFILQIRDDLVYPHAFVRGFGGLSSMVQGHQVPLVVEDR